MNVIVVVLCMMGFVWNVIDSLVLVIIFRLFELLFIVIVWCGLRLSDVYVLCSRWVFMLVLMILLSILLVSLLLMILSVFVCV